MNTVRKSDLMLSYYYRNLAAEERLLFRVRDWKCLDAYLGVYGFFRRRRGIGWLFRRNRYATHTAKIIVYELFGFRLRFLRPDRKFRKEGGER